MRFKVIQGQHWMNKKAYSSGSVVETNRRLDRTFPGRFEKLPEERPIVEPEPVVESKPEPVTPEPEPVTPEPEPVTPEPEPATKKKTARKKSPTKRKTRTRRKAE